MVAWKKKEPGSFKLSYHPEPPNSRLLLKCKKMSSTWQGPIIRFLFYIAKNDTDSATKENLWVTVRTKKKI